MSGQSYTASISTELDNMFGICRTVSGHVCQAVCRLVNLLVIELFHYLEIFACALSYRHDRCVSLVHMSL